MNEIIEYIKTRGYVRMKELKEAGFHTRNISALVRSGEIEKVKAGLYKIPYYEKPENITSFLDIAKAVPKGVVCLLSAVSYYELSTVNPSEVFIAIPLSEKTPKLSTLKPLPTRCFGSRISRPQPVLRKPTMP